MFTDSSLDAPASFRAVRNSFERDSPHSCPAAVFGNKRKKPRNSKEVIGFGDMTPTRIFLFVAGGILF